MNTETVENPLQTAAEPPAVKPKVEPNAGQKAEGNHAEGEQTQEEGEKKPLSDEEREKRRLLRRIDNLTKQRERFRAERDIISQQLQQPRNSATTEAAEGDSDSLTLSRAEIAQLIDAEARKLAPTISEQAKETERRRAVVDGLAKSLGQERFDQLAEDLDAAFDGILDADKRPKPAADAIFEADNPQAVIEYLADLENAEEARALSRMSAVQAGRALARIEAKLAAQKAEQKPQPSKAATPVETVRAAAPNNGRPDPRDTKAWIAWANQQEAKGRFK